MSDLRKKAGNLWHWSYAERPSIVTELAAMESASAADLVRFFTADAETRQQAIERVIGRGGYFDADGKWVDAGL